MSERADHAIADELAEEHPSGASADLKRMEDRYKRAVADLDNYRKRVERELEGRLAAGRDGVHRDWFEAVDSVERAVRSQPEDADRSSLASVLDQMNVILQREGVHRVGAPGEQFDPALHEAVEVRERGDLPDRSIIEVVRSGFATDGRVLRPALVVVSKLQESTG